MAETNFTSGGFLYLYFCVFIAFLNSAINGFDNSLMGGVIVMDGFKKDFGDLSAAANPSINGLLFCLLQLGAITAFPFVGPVSDKWGRLWGMRVGSITIIVGAILEIATTVLGLFCVGRYLIGFGVCFVVSSAPTYVVEIAHPVFRGRATAVYNSGWHVGAIPAAVIIYALQQAGAKDSSSWQIPCGIQGVWSIVVLGGTFFMPESPRYLVSVGKLEAARDFMVKYHASGDASHPIIEEQMQEIEQAIQAEKAQKSDTYAALFATRANRLRVGIMVGVGFFSQTAGNWIASYFQSQVVAYFGFTTVEQALMLNIVTGCISLVASFGGSSLVDKFGRRPYLVYGTASYIFFFAILTLLVGIYNQGEIQETAQGPIAAGIAGFVFLQLFGISYSICWTSINALYPVEVLSYSTRAKGMALCQAMVNVANIVQSWVLSYGLNAYKWKFFSFYVVFNTFALVVIYFYFPETKGRTLEEIDEIFQAPNPVKKSLEKPERTLEDFVKGNRGEKVAEKA